MKKLTPEDRVLKLVLIFNQINVPEKVAFKQKMFNEIKKKMDGCSALVFMKLCINANLLVAKRPESFFMNLIMESLEGIVFEKLFLKDIEEEEPAAKKKTKKKKNKGTANAGLETTEAKEPKTEKQSSMTVMFSKPPIKVVGEEQKPNAIAESKPMLTFPAPAGCTTDDAKLAPLNPLSQNGSKKRKKKSSTKPEQNIQNTVVEPVTLDPVENEKANNEEDTQQKPSLVVVNVAQNTVQTTSKSRKKGRKRAQLVELTTKDYKVDFDEIKLGKLRTESEPAKLDSNTIEQNDVKELSREMQETDDPLADLKKPLLPDESTDSGPKAPKDLSDLPQHKNPFSNLYQNPLEEENHIQRNASRKGSLSVDLLQGGRVKQSSSPSPDLKLQSQPKLTVIKPLPLPPQDSKIEAKWTGSDEFEIDTQKHSDRAEEHYRAQSRQDDLELISRDSCRYSISETQSQADGQSMNLPNDSGYKNSQKKPKLRKLVKEAGARRDRQAHPSMNNQYQHQASNPVPAVQSRREAFAQREQRSTKDDYRLPELNTPSISSSSVRPGMSEREQRDSWDIRDKPNAKDPKKLPPKKTKEPEKPSKLQKSTNLKPKKLEPIIKTVSSKRWEDTPEPINFDQKQTNSSLKTDLKITKNFSTIDGEQSKLRTYFNKSNSQSSDGSNSSDNENRVNRQQTEQSGSVKDYNPRVENDAVRPLKMTNTPPPPLQKTNKFLNQKHKLTTEFHPPSQSLFTPSYPKVGQNRYSLEDPKGSALTAQIQAATISLCQNKDFYLNDQECSPKTNKVINETLNCVVKQLDSDVRLILNGLDQFNQTMSQPRKMILERISDIVERSFNGTLKVKAYGSFETGLLTPFSDLDLAITGAIVESTSEQIKSMLRLVRDNLGLFDFVLNSTLIETASVPVLKLEADASLPYEQFPTTTSQVKVKVDLIVETLDPLNPITAAMRTTEYMRNCQHWYKSFLPNVLCFKYIANFNQLTNTYCGNLNRRN